MSEWKHNVITQTIMANRRGWKGAWDAVKAATTGNDRLTVPTPITVSFWIKTDSPDTKVEYNIAAIELEHDGVKLP